MMHNSLLVWSLLIYFQIDKFVSHSRLFVARNNLSAISGLLSFPIC